MENLSERKKKEWITEISFPIFPLFSFFPLLLIFSLFLFSVFLSRFRFSPQEIPLALRPHISQPYINIRRSFEPVSSRGRPFLCQRIVMGRSPEDIVHETWKNGRERLLDAKHFYYRHLPSLSPSLCRPTVRRYCEDIRVIETSYNAGKKTYSLIPLLLVCL